MRNRNEERHSLSRSRLSRIRQAGAVGAALVAMSGTLYYTGGKASATPATLGFYPSTDIYGKGIFHFDADTYGRSTRMDAAVTSGLTYGFGPDTNKPFGRTEFGFDYIVSLGGISPPLSFTSGLPVRGSNRLLFNVKTQLFNNDAQGTRVVAGLWGLGSKQVGAPDVGYLLGSKAFKWGRVHAGVAHSFQSGKVGGISVIAAPSGRASRTYLQLGYDKLITPKLAFAADFYSGKSGISGVQPTIYYNVNDKASFGLGWMRFNDPTVVPTRNQIYLCFDYNFGGKSAPAAPSPTESSPTDGAPAGTGGGGATGTP